MKEEEIQLSRFNKQELLATLERLFLGYYISPMNECLEAEEKNEMVVNYLAIKKAINESEAN